MSLCVTERDGGEEVDGYWDQNISRCAIDQVVVSNCHSEWNILSKITKPESKAKYYNRFLVMKIIYAPYIYI